MSTSLCRYFFDLIPPPLPPSLPPSLPTLVSSRPFHALYSIYLSRYGIGRNTSHTSAISPGLLVVRVTAGRREAARARPKGVVWKEGEEEEEEEGGKEERWALKRRRRRV